MQTLKTEAQQIQQLKAELIEARKVILQLSEANQQLQATFPSKPQPAQPLAKSQIAPKPLPSAPEPGLDKSQTPAQVAPAGIVPMPGRDLPKHELALRKVLAHPTQPGVLPNMPSEKDNKLGEVEIGWMD
ncbi:MAG: hypothetical protein HC772_16135 [Leptolyngbyaceae cyanobacterium CRU_2_3]|nr:hypothetical protein [Leptolyngbyaceae cyanobacterium CRU_2_3]